MARHSILTAAKLIAPVIEHSFASGFDWYNNYCQYYCCCYFVDFIVVVVIVFRCIEVVKSSQHSGLASELEITKSLMFLRENDTTKVLLLFIVVVIVYCCCLL